MGIIERYVGCVLLAVLRFGKVVIICICIYRRSRRRCNVERMLLPTHRRSRGARWFRFVWTKQGRSARPMCLREALAAGRRQLGGLRLRGRWRGAGTRCAWGMGSSVVLLSCSELLLGG